MKKMLNTGRVVAMVVTDPEDEYIGVFDAEEDAVAFVADYNRPGGLLRLKVIVQPVYKYATTDGI